MVYSSVVFIFFFLPLLLALYYLLPKLWYKNLILFAGSMIFYAWAEGKMLFLLLFISLCAWIFSSLIAQTRFKRLFLYAGVILLLLILGYYKYFSFLITSVFNIQEGALASLKILMPLGISFYTFQAISYLVDVYRNAENYEKNPIYLVLYITMFPQLILGPLVKYEKMGPQLRARKFDFDFFTDGIRRFIIGLAKKVLIANSLGTLVDTIMNTEIQFIGPATAWLGIFAYTLQLFYDFSGYTDMAIGTGKMLGFTLPENFNYPYISKSLTEFWRRWHITLSGWLRDYVFMPLSIRMRYGKKAGVFLSLLITFIICGIWHSAGWNFLIWGAIHGLVLGTEYLFLGKWLKKLRGFSVIYLLFVVTVSFVFVRTHNLQQAFDYLKAMFSPAGLMAKGPEAFAAAQHVVVLLIAVIFCIPVAQYFKTEKKILLSGIRAVSFLLLIAVFLLSVMAIMGETHNPFLYFNY